MPNILEVFIVGLVLSSDSFSAALALGVKPHKLRDSFIFATLSGVTEGLVFLLGAIAGLKVINEFDLVGHLVSFALLIIVAIHMFYEGLAEYREKSKPSEKPLEFHRLWKIVFVSFATSLDAFAVGVSFGVLDRPLVPFVVSISLLAFFATLLGMKLAKFASGKIGSVVSFSGALILFLLAFKFLLEGL